MFSMLEAGEALQLEIHGAHLNHGLRGAEADGDEAFVRSLCRENGVSFTTERAASPPDTGNLEQWARGVRYRFLEEVRGRLGFQRIALGHTRDDLAETVLMRLIRGSGLTGLACLRPVREGGLIRPMIDLTRDQLLAYLETIEQPFRMDSSNNDLHRLRNRVRHELIPSLERNYNPRIKERLAVTAGLIRDDDEWLEREAGRELARLTDGADDGPLSLPGGMLLELPTALARRVVRRALACSAGHLRRIDRRHVEAVLELAAARSSEEKRLQLPGELLVRYSRGRLLFEIDPVGTPEPWSCQLAIPGQTRLAACGLVAVASVGPGPEEAGEWPGSAVAVALLDAGRATAAGLVLRSNRPGDRYRPSGTPGRRKISRMLIDDGVPRYRRHAVPLLVAGEEVIWLPGHLPRADWCWKEGMETGCLRLDLLPAGDIPADR